MDWIAPAWKRPEAAPLYDEFFRGYTGRLRVPTDAYAVAYVGEISRIPFLWAFTKSAGIR